MKLDNVKKWLTLVANFGVVAGIIFLAIEIRQNQEMLERDHALALLDSASMEVARFTQQRALRIQDKELMQIWIDGLAGKELDEADQARFMSMCTENLWSDVLIYERSVALERTAFELAAIESVRTRIAELPSMKACWDKRKIGFVRWGYSDFVDAVESR